MTDTLKSIYLRLLTLKQAYRRYFPSRKSLGHCGKNTFIEYPIFIDTPGNMHVEENVIIRSLFRGVNSPTENIYIKKYTVIGPDCTIVTNNHRSTVTLPQFLLTVSHVNDESADIIIEEDSWTGAKVILLPGAHLGRGSIVGAGAIISTEIPPYSVAVGRGRIIARKFDKEGIKKHEQALYKEEERMTDKEIDDLFREHLEGLRTYGCDTGFSENDIKAINQQKKDLNFIEP